MTTFHLYVVLFSLGSGDSNVQVFPCVKVLSSKGARDDLQHLLAHLSTPNSVSETLNLKF